MKTKTLQPIKELNINHAEFEKQRAGMIARLRKMADKFGRKKTNFSADVFDLRRMADALEHPPILPQGRNA